MSELTREDMLRELELLPVWKLRQPLSESLTISTVETKEPVAAKASVPAEPVELSDELSLPLRALPSEDGTYLFLMQSALLDEAVETLLQNMLRAMRVICRSETQGSAAHIFNEYKPKLIICFGEEAANQLTQQSLDMAQWRSHQPHHFQQLPLIVTFTPQHLLQHHQDKALTWQDLCLAMQLIQSL